MVIHRERRVSGCSAGNLLASRRVRSMRITTGPGRGSAGRARRWPRLRWAAAALGVAAAGATAFVLMGGGGHAGRRALTSDEANRLAITRFRNYQAGGRAVTITVPSTGGGLVVTGSVDY